MPAPPPPHHGSERATLIAFLDSYRAVLIDKASGLSDVQVHTALAPSSLTLGGLINHMAFVEDHWFTSVFAGRPMTEPWASAPWEDDRDWEFATAPEVATPELFERYRESISRSDAILSGVDDLGAVSQHTNADGDTWSMRWILVHMVEETARHCGHADLIRESLDGSVGDIPFAEI